MYLFLSILAPLAILSATFFIFEASALNAPNAQMHAYQACFTSFFIIALCIEMRVRMGFKLPRGRLFWVHLPCAISFFLLLGALSIFTLPRWVDFLELGLFLVVLSTGSVLFYRGLMQTLSTTMTNKKLS